MYWGGGAGGVNRQPGNEVINDRVPVVCQELLIPIMSEFHDSEETIEIAEKTYQTPKEQP